ncbi:unnamed protein product [Dibothriocephalus latus]|uniref:Uncharacterized protein n=1 Tax=Dibothriocephalus latus TaxID=60516 RepID=A0A3P7LKA7_DIBLA|nr:unnamed protein product [Dibothriocephalus latus]
MDMTPQLRVPWFTKCILAYLLCACPPIWIIELHHLQQLNDATKAAIQQQAAQKQPELAPNPWDKTGLQYNKPNVSNSVIQN